MLFNRLYERGANKFRSAFKPVTVINSQINPFGRLMGQP